MKNQKLLKEEEWTSMDSGLESYISRIVKNRPVISNGFFHKKPFFQSYMLSPSSQTITAEEFDLDILFQLLYVNISELDMVAVMLQGYWAAFGHPRQASLEDHCLTV